MRSCLLLERTLPALGPRADLSLWPPLEHRARNPQGKHGCLHAKCALADADSLVISSANLTDYTLTLHLEMGLLVRSSPLTSR